MSSSTPISRFNAVSITVLPANPSITDKHASAKTRRLIQPSYLADALSAYRATPARTNANELFAVVGISFGYTLRRRVRFSPHPIKPAVPTTTAVNAAARVNTTEERLSVLSGLLVLIVRVHRRFQASDRIIARGRAFEVIERKQ